MKMSKNDETIKIQKEIAKSILKDLEVIDPNCILAGGAPRDWFFNKPANDLDYYIHVDELQRKFIGDRLARLGYKGAVKLGHKDPTYKSLKTLKEVWEFEHMGQRVQVMVMSESTYTSVLSHFNLDTSKAWWKGYSVRYEPEFILAHMFKLLMVDGDEPPKSAYVDKMTARYPDYLLTLRASYDVFLKMYALEHNLRRCDKHSVIHHWLSNCKDLV